MVTTEKALMGLYTESRQSMTFLPFLFSCLIINLVIFLLSTIILPFAEILSLICLGMCIIVLFVSVIILFVYDTDRYGTAATSGKELFEITIYELQSLLFVIRGFAWDALAVPDPPFLLYFFYCK